MLHLDMGAIPFPLGLPCLAFLPAFFPDPRQIGLPCGAGSRIIPQRRRGIAPAAYVEEQSRNGAKVATLSTFLPCIFCSPG
jgi:hypothetical protein